jgi:hypothetical protein
MGMQFNKIIAPKEQNINSNGCKPVEKVASVVGKYSHKTRNAKFTIAYCPLPIHNNSSLIFAR